ncbi:IS66 family insertion sequence element accessory protein TnpB [Paraburkholderia sp. ZP32-5]|uniref:IS66 family insertion sequence element accessory protein TnpB n=1 Tax=Paraburkholderia sp. ZP32-5 TaxID=2883245 RepID=UPI003FA37262
MKACRLNAASDAMARNLRQGSWLPARCFSAAHPHHAYLFANSWANRVKMLVHDGIGIWLAERRLNQGQFVWSREGCESRQYADARTLAGLVLDLP